MSSWEDMVAFYSNMSGVSPALKRATLAQWMLESGRGSSQLARNYLNFAGMKFRARMASICEGVDYRGGDGDLATYCTFSGVEKFVQGYWHFIATGPYDGWKGFEDDSAGYIRHLFKRGYAADPDYVGRVLALFEEAGELLAGASNDGSAAPSVVVEGHAVARLAVIVGHNSVARGAWAGSPLSVAEFPFNSRVAARMRDEADEYNLVCEVFFREPLGSYTKEIAQAYAAVERWRPDCCVELHFNSGPASAMGSEILVGSGRPEGRSLADNVQEEILGALKLRNRMVKVAQPTDRGGGSLYALPDVPSIIVEPFFGSNADDCLRVGSLGEDVLARAYLRGVRDWAVARHV